MNSPLRLYAAGSRIDTDSGGEGNDSDGSQVRVSYCCGKLVGADSGGAACGHEDSLRDESLQVSVCRVATHT